MSKENIAAFEKMLHEDDKLWADFPATRSMVPAV